MKMKKALALGLVTYSTILLSFVALATPKSIAAGSATLSLSPSSGSYDKGESFTVTVTENSGTDGINAVQADLKYDSSELQYISSTASTYFNNVSHTGGGGKVSIISYVAPIQMQGPGTVSGSKVVGTVTFKALVGSGTTSITFATTSGIARASDNVDIWNQDTSGGTYTLKTPSTGSTSGGGSPSGSGGSTSTSSGSDSSSAPAPASGSPSPSEQSSDPAAPIPATTKSSSNGTYMVAVKVVDGKGHIVSDATVNLGTNTAKTDKNGIASFLGITAGRYNVTVKGGSVKGTSTITVDGTLPTTALQQFEVKAKPVYNWPLYGAIAGGVLILVILLAIIKGRMGGSKPNFSHGNYGQNSAGTPTVVTTIGSGSSTPATPSAPAVVAPPPPKADDNLVKPTVVSPSPKA